MLSFAKALGASAYVNPDAALDIVTQATPLTAAKTQAGFSPALWPLFVGNHNGSLGETSALACIIGGLYLCFRRSASWEIPLGIILSVSILAGLANLLDLTPLTLLHHLAGGSLVFGAFFIATDPVSSPFGTHLVEVLERRRQDVGEQMLRQQAERQLREERGRESYDLWLRRLREEAYVKFRVKPSVPR